MNLNNLLSRKNTPSDETDVLAGAEEDGLKPKQSWLNMDISFGKKKTEVSEMTWTSPVRPSAFLLPNYIRHRRAMKRAKRVTGTFALWGVLVILLLSVGSFALAMMAGQEQKEADIAFEESRLELRELSVASTFFNGLDERQSRVTEMLSAEVDYAKVLGGVASALPAGSSLNGFTTKFGQPCATPDPFNMVEAIGCIEFTATVDSLSAAARMLDAANNNPSDFVNSFVVTSTSSSGERYTLVGTANFTADAFVYRFGNQPAQSPENSPLTPGTGGDEQSEPDAEPTQDGDE